MNSGQAYLAGDFVKEVLLKEMHRQPVVRTVLLRRNPNGTVELQLGLDLGGVESPLDKWIIAVAEAQGFGVLTEAGRHRLEGVSGASAKEVNAIHGVGGQRRGRGFSPEGMGEDPTLPSRLRRAPELDVVPLRRTLSPGAGRERVLRGAGSRGISPPRAAPARRALSPT